MKKVLIAGAARRDLSEIAAYKEANWGAAQKRPYLNRIRKRMRELHDNPGIGVQREDISPGYRLHAIYEEEGYEATEIPGMILKFGAALKPIPGLRASDEDG
jgi:plasmid stabilization system protein ParE